MIQRDRITIQQDLLAAGYILPFLSVFLLFLGWPILYSLWISLHQVTIFSDFYDIFGTMKFVGLKNYAFVLSDKVFWWSIFLTFFYAAFTISGGITLSLALALFLNRKRRGFGVLRSGFFLPNVFDVYVVGVIWLMLYNPNGGPVSEVLRWLKMSKLADTGVLGSPWLVLPAIGFAMILKNAGFGMILFLTSLNNINEAIFEAADVDGATRWQKIRHVILPMLKPTIMFLSITGLVGSLNAFGEIYAMTDGSGGTSVTVAGNTFQSARISGFHLYQTFNNSDYGMAAAISFVLLVFASLISIINIKFLSPKD
jgi:ABC-type sugar transport system permease subunit